MQYLLWKPGVSDENKWTELPFPDIVTEVRPAITGGQGDWLTVAFCDNENGVQRIGTNKDLERSHAWPESIQLTSVSDPTAQSFWKPILGIDMQTIDGLGIIRYQDYTIVSWRTNPFRGVSFWFAEHNGMLSGAVTTHLSSHIESGPSLVVFNNSLFIAYRDHLDRIVIDHLNFFPPSSVFSS
jgi:hypothetical protein